MIIAITDAKGLTRIIENQQIAEQQTTYKKLFEKHISNLINTDIRWNIIKTTGDGLLITARPRGSTPEIEKFCLDWCSVMYDLYESFSDPYPIRIVAHWCDEDRLIKINGLLLQNDFIEDLSKFLDHIKLDIFGSDVNLIFRLAQNISVKTFVITDNLMEKVIQNETDKMDLFNKKEKLSINNFEFGSPVPITFLKGIDRIGFSCNCKKVIWLWEVKKALGI